VRRREIDRVKNRRRTALAVEGESPYYRLVQIMDDVDTLGRPRTVEERLAAVNAVTEESIAECFARYPVDGPGYLTSVGPRAWPALN
jgi:predicted Zn-dependent peptidase